MRKTIGLIFFVFFPKILNDNFFWATPLLNPLESINSFQNVFSRSELTSTVTTARYSSSDAAPQDHSNKFKYFFEIFEKVEFLHDHGELGIDNGTVMFSERSPIRRRNNFQNPIQFEIIDFLSSADLGNVVGDFFGANFEIF